DRDVLDLRVRIVRRHHAPLAERRDTDDRSADPHALARPRPLGVTRGAADENVGPESPAIHAEPRDGAVRGDEKWQDVKALGPVEARQPDVRSDGLTEPSRDRLRAAGLAVDQRLVVRAEAPVKSEQSRVAASRAAITRDARMTDRLARGPAGPHP